MAKNKQLKQTKQLKFDKMMISVGLFSILGGFMVFKSYAGRRVNTTKPGSVSVSAINKTGIFYNMSFDSKLKYCFKSPQARARVVIYSAGSLSESHDISKGCFVPNKSYNGVRTMVTGVSVDSQLVISKQ